MSRLIDNDIRAELVTLSRLLDPRVADSIPALIRDQLDMTKTEPVRRHAEQETWAQTGRAVEALFHVVEEFCTDVHRIAAALEQANRIVRGKLRPNE